MKKIISTLSILFISLSINAQSNPWQGSLKTCTSTNGTTFSAPIVLQDSSSVGSIIRIGSLTSDTLMSAFQWFPAPVGNLVWDKIAVKFSYNGGLTWTAPTSCTFVGLPSNFKRPFDPSLFLLPNSQIRMYFSSGLQFAPTGGVDTYSGISNDGITYTFEPVPKFNHATKNAIDPSVINFSGTYYYNSWTSVANDGALRATSLDGITFTTQATFPYDNNHLWLGNYMLDGSNLKFYGCGGAVIWYNTSTNGSTWNGYVNTNVMGADPAVVKNKAGLYVMIYSAPPSTTGIRTRLYEAQLTVVPTVFSRAISALHEDSNKYVSVDIIDVWGKHIYYREAVKINEEIVLEHIECGIYYCTIKDGSSVTIKKIVKLN